MAKKVKVNEQALKGWISPSLSELQPKELYNMQFGKTIMTVEEFESHFPEYYKDKQ